MSLKHVEKHVLANGLTILIKKTSVIPKVSTQLWYNVGSKDEKSGEKGIAHLIEHMLFKGTKRLSESDINQITHKLSGYTNAFTSYDYTGYLFDFPTQHWREALPLLADCMVNASFKEDHLASELKAVIQELKLYKDDYASSMIEGLLSAIFADHPYHHPIIGYKQDLWTLHRDALVKFYKHHYIPNNSTLVLVGDVSVDEALTLAEKEFGALKPDFSYTKEKFYHGTDLARASITLYRDVQAPMGVFAWVIPGGTSKSDYVIDVASWILGSGKGSRLYKKLVDELQLVTDLDMFSYDLFDYGVLFLYFQPKDASRIETIAQIVQEEITTLAHQLASAQELVRATKQLEAEYLSILESNQKQAYALGKFYLATQDEEYLYTLTAHSQANLAHEVQEFMSQYVRPSVMHQGLVLPLTQEERHFWVKTQEIADQEDAVILARKTREVEVEPGLVVAEIQVHEPKPFVFPRAQNFSLENGLKVLYAANTNLPKIDLVIDFEAKQTYDPQGKEGLSNFVASLLLEGTKNYSAQAFADTVESYGMTLASSPGLITMSLLTPDLAKALELLEEMLVNATFSSDAIEKVRAQILAELQEFWDTPRQFAGQLVRETLYKNHPYAHNPLGTQEGVKSITREDILSYYKQYVSPRGARVALVGDCERYDIKDLFETLLSSWKGPAVEKLVFPPLENPEWQEIDYAILRDQTVLCYGAFSVDHMDQDYDKLLLFEQIFTGGILGSMASRLFDLRERSGLFYTIGGSLVAGADKDKGLIVIRTIVSNDRLKEAEVAIEHTINTAIETVAEDEFSEAQQALINSLVDNFATNQQTALTLLFKDKFNLPDDYYDTRAQHFLAITKEEMQHAVKKYLKTDRFVLLRVGRGCA